MSELDDKPMSRFRLVYTAGLGISEVHGGGRKKLDPQGAALFVPIILILLVLELACTVPIELGKAILDLFGTIVQGKVWVGTGPGEVGPSLIDNIPNAICFVVTLPLIPPYIAVPLFLKACRRVLCALSNLDIGLLYEYDTDLPFALGDAPRKALLAAVPWPYGNGAYKEFFVGGTAAAALKQAREEKFAKDEAKKRYYHPRYPNRKENDEATGSALELALVRYEEGDGVQAFVLEFEDGSRRGSVLNPADNNNKSLLPLTEDDWELYKACKWSKTVQHVPPHIIIAKPRPSLTLSFHTHRAGDKVVRVDGNGVRSNMQGGYSALCGSLCLVMASGSEHRFGGSRQDGRKFSFAVPEGAWLLGLTFEGGVCTGLKLSKKEEEIAVNKV
ncbi:hypothetical protein TeGR_g2748 [Tetraparma gracilis]|uniref:Uncharacterized protein n=1 Tax=Tetraparma gracilis TaxID=2962635 RepID=A0ABQ6NAJ7_9STRA|nr:hypothetical protein TeGR_g2748 [Tetraparma gracilis]